MQIQNEHHLDRGDRMIVKWSNSITKEKICMIKYWVILSSQKRTLNHNKTAKRLFWQLFNNIIPTEKGFVLQQLVSHTFERLCNINQNKNKPKQKKGRENGIVFVLRNYEKLIFIKRF